MAQEPRPKNDINLVKVPFAEAGTHLQKRDATFENARHLAQTYFSSSSGFTVTDHGALTTPIRYDDREIAADDTCLLEIKRNGSNIIHAMMLAANADADAPTGVATWSKALHAVQEGLYEEIQTRLPVDAKDRYCLFVIIMLRSSIAFLYIIQCYASGKAYRRYREGCSTFSEGKWTSFAMACA